MPTWWIKERLEQKKMSLVSQYNVVLDKINRYNVPIGYESKPLQELKDRKQWLENEIKEINNLLYHNDWDDR